MGGEGPCGLLFPTNQQINKSTNQKIRHMPPLKIGVPLFMLRPENMSAVAVRAEQLGFESVWVAEHLVFPTQIRSRYPYAAEGVPPINPATPLLDPLLVLMQIAARTERIRLGTNVYILPLRHPLIVARMTMRSEERRGG